MITTITNQDSNLDIDRKIELKYALGRARKIYKEKGGKIFALGVITALPEKKFNRPRSLEI